MVDLNQPPARFGGWAGRLLFSWRGFGSFGSRGRVPHTSHRLCLSRAALVVQTQRPSQVDWWPETGADGLGQRNGTSEVPIDQTSLGAEPPSEPELHRLRLHPSSAVSVVKFEETGCPAMTNTGRLTSRHMDTMDELVECIEQFVRSARINSIEEGRLLRLARHATDEAQLLDYAYALQMCGMKENGVFGQRFSQLFREAEAFRAGMLERQKETA